MGAGNRLSEPFSDASRFEVYTAGQKRRVTPQIKREFKRRAAVDPVIGHLKAEHRILAKKKAGEATGGNTGTSPECGATVESIATATMVIRMPYR